MDQNQSVDNFIISEISAGKSWDSIKETIWSQLPRESWEDMPVDDSNKRGSYRGSSKYYWMKKLCQMKQFDRCARCNVEIDSGGDDTRPFLHHQNYDKYYAESIDKGDVVIFCGKCHKDHHAKGDLKMSDLSKIGKDSVMSNSVEPKKTKKKSKSGYAMYAACTRKMQEYAKSYSDFTPAEMASYLELKKKTTSTILSVLNHMGFVIRVSNNPYKYEFGSEFPSLAGNEQYLMTLYHSKKVCREPGENYGKQVLGQDRIWLLEKELSKKFNYQALVATFKSSHKNVTTSKEPTYNAQTATKILPQTTVKDINFNGKLLNNINDAAIIASDNGQYRPETILALKRVSDKEGSDFCRVMMNMYCNGKKMHS